MFNRFFAHRFVKKWIDLRQDKKIIIHVVESNNTRTIASAAAGLKYDTD